MTGRVRRGSKGRRQSNQKSKSKSAVEVEVEVEVEAMVERTKAPSRKKKVQTFNKILLLIICAVGVILLCVWLS